MALVAPERRGDAPERLTGGTLVGILSRSRGSMPRTLGGRVVPFRPRRAFISVVSFVMGAATSVLSGWIGMRIAVYSNSRTAVSAATGFEEGHSAHGYVAGFQNERANGGEACREPRAAFVRLAAGEFGAGVAEHEDFVTLLHRTPDDVLVPEMQRAEFSNHKAARE